MHSRQSLSLLTLSKHLKCTMQFSKCFEYSDSLNPHNNLKWQMYSLHAYFMHENTETSERLGTF